MKLYELFDQTLDYDEDMDAIYILLKTVPSKNEIQSYYLKCDGNLNCIYDKLITFNKGWQLIERIKGKDFAKQYLKKILGI